VTITAGNTTMNSTSSGAKPVAGFTADARSTSGGLAAPSGALEISPPSKPTPR
jgi:hypothetical protein